MERNGEDIEINGYSHKERETKNLDPCSMSCLEVKQDRAREAHARIKQNENGVLSRLRLSYCGLQYLGMASHPWAPRKQGTRVLRYSTERKEIAREREREIRHTVEWSWCPTRLSLNSTDHTLLCDSRQGMLFDHCGLLPLSYGALANQRLLNFNFRGYGFDPLISCYFRYYIRIHIPDKFRHHFRQKNSKLHFMSRVVSMGKPSLTLQP